MECSKYFNGNKRWCGSINLVLVSKRFFWGGDVKVEVWMMIVKNRGGWSERERYFWVEEKCVYRFEVEDNMGYLGELKLVW